MKSVFYYLRYLQETHKILIQQDSIYKELVKATKLRFQTGEANLLENTTAVSKSQETENQLLQNESEIKAWQNRLQILLNTSQNVDANSNIPFAYSQQFVMDKSGLSNNPSLQLSKQAIDIEEQKVKVAKAQTLPDFNIGYINQSLQGYYDINGVNEFAGKSTRFQSVQVGIAIPIWFKPHTSQIQSAKLHAQAAELDYQQLQNQLNADFITSYQAYKKLLRSNEYYINTGLPQAELILTQSILGFKEGEVTYLEYINGLTQSMDIQFGYLDNLNQLNQAIISIEYLLGNN